MITFGFLLFLNDSINNLKIRHIIPVTIPEDQRAVYGLVSEKHIRGIFAELVLN